MKQARENILDRALHLRFIGSFAKETRNRTISMQFSNLGTAFGVQSAGKSIEIYDVKNAEEIEKKRKRRLKRRREKENSKKIKLEENRIDERRIAMTTKATRTRTRKTKIKSTLKTRSSYLP